MTVVVAAIIAPVAFADSSSGVITSASFTPATPARAGSDAMTTAQLNFAYSDGSDTAKSLVLTFADGYLAAPAAVDQTCSSAELAASACPASSEVGTGQAIVGTVIGDQTAMVGIYLMPPPSPSAVVGVGVEINATVLAIPIALTTSGTATLITGPGGQPTLQISLPNLPNSAPVPVVGSVAIQLKQLTIVLNSQAPSGKQFVYLPTNCSVATTAFAVSTDEGASGNATADFTPTGCPLSYTGLGVKSAVQTNSSNFDAAFETNVTFPGGANTNNVTVGIPTAALRANPIYAALHCPTAVPFTGCTPIGTVTAVTPLLSSALTGKAYLTGSAAGGYGLGLTFPVPFNAIALSGTVDSSDGVTVVTFSGIPDLPLTSLQLVVNTGPTGAFMAGCGTGTQTLTAATVGNGGAGTAKTSTALDITGCPNVGANGGGRQVATYPSTRTSDGKTAPRVTAKRISAITTGRPAVRLSLHAGSAQLRSFELVLPRGLSFATSRLNRALRTSAAATHRLVAGKLMVTLTKPEASVTVVIRAGGLNVSQSLKHEVRTRRTQKLTFHTSVASVGFRAPTQLRFTIGATH